MWIKHHRFLYKLHYSSNQVYVSTSSIDLDERFKYQDSDPWIQIKSKTWFLNLWSSFKPMNLRLNLSSSRWSSKALEYITQKKKNKRIYKVWSLWYFECWLFSRCKIYYLQISISPKVIWSTYLERRKWKLEKIK